MSSVCILHSEIWRSSEQSWLYLLQLTQLANVEVRSWTHVLQIIWQNHICCINKVTCVPLTCIQMLKIHAELRAPPWYTKLLLRSLSPKVQKEKEAARSRLTLSTVCNTNQPRPHPIPTTTWKPTSSPEHIPGSKSQHWAPASPRTPCMLTYACQQVTGLEKHSPRAWKGIRVLWTEMHCVFNAAYYSQHQEAEPRNLAASCKILRSASQSGGKLVPVACSGPDFGDLSSSPDPEAFRWNGTPAPSPACGMAEGHLAACLRSWPILKHGA